MSVTGSLGVSSLTEFSTQESRWIFYLSQIFTDEQKPFCEQGEPTNACRQTTDITEFTAMYHRTFQLKVAVRFCEIG